MKKLVFQILINIYKLFYAIFVHLFVPAKTLESNLLENGSKNRNFHFLFFLRERNGGLTAYCWCILIAVDWFLELNILVKLTFWNWYFVVRTLFGHSDWRYFGCCWMFLVLLCPKSCPGSMVDRRKWISFARSLEPSDNSMLFLCWIVLSSFCSCKCNGRWHFRLFHIWICIHFEDCNNSLNWITQISVFWRMNLNPCILCYSWFELVHQKLNFHSKFLQIGKVELLLSNKKEDGCHRIVLKCFHSVVCEQLNDISK